jgi:hypothetical protein
VSEETTNLPVSWEEQMKADAKAQISAERPALAIMSLKSGVMSIGEEPVPGNEISAIVVASVAENSYYSTRYDPNVRTNPDCYAIGEGKAQDLVPYDESKNKQADACVKCEKFEWGSDPNGGRGKACKERRRLALIPADGASEMVLLSIPPTSLKNWANHVAKIVATTGMPSYGVVTQIKVVPSAKNQFEVKFEIVGKVPEHALQSVMAKKAEALEIMTQPYPEIEEEQAPAKKRKF